MVQLDGSVIFFSCKLYSGVMNGRSREFKLLLKISKWCKYTTKRAQKFTENKIGGHLETMRQSLVAMRANEVKTNFWNSILYILIKFNWYGNFFIMHSLGTYDKGRVMNYDRNFTRSLIASKYEKRDEVGRRRKQATH